MRQIETVIQHLVVFHLNLMEAALAGMTYMDLKSRGQLIGTQEILIARICLANNLPIYIQNVSHFSNIEGIRLISSHEILEE